MLRSVRVARRAAAFVLPVAALLGMLVSGCAATAPSEPRAARRLIETSYLPSPLDGYPRSVSVSEAQSVRSAHAGLLSGESAEAAAEAARMLLDADAGLEPAQILWAQADFVGGRFAEALERATPVAERYPDYVAAQLVSARAAEKINRIEEAYEAYLRIEPRSDLASRRARELFPRATEIAANRARDLVAKGRLDEAGAALARLESWAPDAQSTLELVADYAAAAGEPARELGAVKRLSELDESEEWVRRRARLEMEVGDAGEGLRILGELSRRYPEDAALALELERAKFRWRLDLLPADARELLKLPELARGDYAKLLFWLFPDVRYGRPAKGRIASDILDHPYRKEIARVINLDLMRMDSTLHLFDPERPISRYETLESVLRILARRNPAPACLSTDDPSMRLSDGRLCGLAARCGLFLEPGDCLPRAIASGRFVETISFAALDVLGVE